MESMATGKTAGGKTNGRGIRHLLGRGKHQASTAPHPWYPRRKQMTTEVREMSGGTLELISPVYRGDDHRHEFVHTVCDRRIWATIADIKAKGGSVCPYCHEAALLASFGRMEDLQRYVLDTSDRRAYLFANRPIGEVSDTYDFFCFLHGPFQATFSRFLKQRGESNGCPRCESPGRSGERHSNVIFF